MGNEIWDQLNDEGYAEEVKRRVNKFVNFFMPYIYGRKVQTVADFGAGNGYISDFIEHLSGIKPDQFDFYPRKSQKKIDLYDTTTWPSKRYDAVIMSHVMEHITNPIEVFKDLKSVADMLIIAVPDCRGYKHDPFNLDIGHVMYYNRFILSSCLVKAGWRVEPIVKVYDDGYDEIFAIGTKI